MSRLWKETVVGESGDVVGVGVTARRFVDHIKATCHRQ